MTTYLQNDLEQLYWAQFHAPESQDQIIAQHIESIKGYDRYIFTLCWECEYYEHGGYEFFKRFFEAFKGDYVLVQNAVYRNHEPVTKHTIFFNYFEWEAYYRLIKTRSFAHNRTWNRSADHFLLYTGQPNKPHKTRMIWKMDQLGLLDQAHYTLHINEPSIESAHKFIPELTHTEFVEWVHRRNHSLDTPYWKNPGKIGRKTPGFETAQHEWYARSQFRLLIGGGFGDTQIPWITEREYITFLNCVPFIYAGDEGALDVLQAQGFETYQDYVGFTNYNNIYDLPKTQSKDPMNPYEDYRKHYDAVRAHEWPDRLPFDQCEYAECKDHVDRCKRTEQRMDTVITCVRDWLEAMPDVSAQVEHNYYHAISRGCELEKTLVDLCKFVKIEPTVENYDKVLYASSEYS